MLDPVQIVPVLGKRSKMFFFYILHRARRACIIIGDQGTLTGDPGLKSLLDYCSSEGLACPVDQFVTLVARDGITWVTTPRPSHEHIEQLWRWIQNQGIAVLQSRALSGRFWFLVFSKSRSQRFGSGSGGNMDSWNLHVAVAAEFPLKTVKSFFKKISKNVPHFIIQNFQIFLGNCFICNCFSVKK